MVEDKSPPYTLVDGEQRNRESVTFDIPPQSLRMGLKIGQSVKLGFETDTPIPVRAVGHSLNGRRVTGERMWVLVTEVMGGGKYKGVLNNDPVVFYDHLKDGSPIEFEARHVLNIDEPKMRH